MTIEEDGYVVTVTDPPIEGYQDGSTIVVFRGMADTGKDDGEEITFGVDHRMAQDIIDALTVVDDDEGDVSGVALCFVEHWQILSRS